MRVDAKRCTSFGRERAGYGGAFPRAFSSIRARSVLYPAISYRAHTGAGGVLAGTGQEGLELGHKESIVRLLGGAGTARMVLLWVADAVDPITCLTVIDNNVVLVGTALGVVKLLYRPALNQPYQAVSLSNRAQEAVTSIVVEDGYVLAVVGDVGLRRWDLRKLEYDTPIIRGCRYDEVMFVMRHSIGLCSTSITFLSPRSRELASRIFVVRVNGDSCFLELSSQTQFERENLGPLSSSDETVRACAFNGRYAAFIVRGSDFFCRLKVWMVWDSPHQLPLTVNWYDPLSSFQGARFVKDNTIILLIGTELRLCRVSEDELLPIRSKDTVFLFDILHIDAGLFIAYVNGVGQLSLAEVIDWETSSKVVMKPVKPTRSVPSRGVFLLGIPYFIRAIRNADTGYVSVAFNDDRGLQIEENLFQV